MNAFQRMKALITLERALGDFQKQQENNQMNFLKSWKTTLAGLITLGTIAGSTMGFLTHDQAAMIAALAASFGLLSAKDGNVTGGTKQQ